MSTNSSEENPITDGCITQEPCCRLPMSTSETPRISSRSRRWEVGRTESLSDMTHATPVEPVSQCCAYREEGAYIQTVTSWWPIFEGLLVWYDLRTVASSHRKLQGTSLGLPDVEPLVWNTNAVSCSCTIGKSGTGSPATLTSSYATAKCTGMWQSVSVDANVESHIRALALAL